MNNVWRAVVLASLAVAALGCGSNQSKTIAELQQLNRQLMEENRQLKNELQMIEAEQQARDAALAGNPPPKFPGATGGQRSIGEPAFSGTPAPQAEPPTLANKIVVSLASEPASEIPPAGADTIVFEDASISVESSKGYLIGSASQDFRGLYYSPNAIPAPGVDIVPQFIPWYFVRSVTWLGEVEDSGRKFMRARVAVDARTKALWPSFKAPEVQECFIWVPGQGGYVRFDAGRLRVSGVTRNAAGQSVKSSHTRRIQELTILHPAERDIRQLITSLGHHSGSLIYDKELLAGNPTQLDLNGENITDGWLELFVEFQTVEEVSLRHTPNVTDKGIALLAELGGLKSVSLWGMDLSDASLATLEKIASLENLTVTEVEFSEAAVERFKAARPKVNFSYE